MKVNILEAGYKLKDGKNVNLGSFFESFSTNNTISKKDDQAVCKKERVAFESKMSKIENK